MHVQLVGPLPRNPARTASTTGAGAMCSTTGAVAAITATIAMYFTTEAGAAATAR